MFRYIRIFCGIVLSIAFLIISIMWLFAIPSITLGPITDRLLGAWMLFLSIDEGIKVYNIIRDKPERSEE